MSAGATGYGELDTLPGFQNIASPVDSYFEVRAGLDYKSVRASLGSIEPEGGLVLALEGIDQYVESEHFPVAHFDFSAGDAAAARPLLTLAPRHGRRRVRRPRQPVRQRLLRRLPQQLRRPRGVSALPRAALLSRASRSTRSKRTTSARRSSSGTCRRWRPRFGNPTLHSSWVDVAFFGGVLVTDPGDGERQREFTTYGVQIDTRFTLLTHLQLTLSLGAAHGRRAAAKRDDEYLISLKLPPL